MPAKTPDSIFRESLGSLTLHVATFTTTNIDDDDTWASGIPSVVAQWANATNDPTTNTHGIDVSLTTVANGTFTFRVGASNKEALVFVLSRT